jgi:hypothetical protein
LTFNAGLEQGKTDNAGKYFSRAIKYLSQSRAEFYLSQAIENLTPLKKMLDFRLGTNIAVI